MTEPTPAEVQAMASTFMSFLLPKVTRKRKEPTSDSESQLADVLPVLPIVNLVQQFDIAVYTRSILDTWTPTSGLWPDPTRNPEVTRHLLMCHAADILAPYLLAFFQRLSLLSHPPKSDSEMVGGYTLKTLVHESHVSFNLDLCLRHVDDDEVELPLDQVWQGLWVIRQKPYTWFKISVSDSNLDFRDCLHLFSACPLFTSPKYYTPEHPFWEVLFYYEW